jgi:hypothetical protein
VGQRQEGDRSVSDELIGQRQREFAVAPIAARELLFAIAPKRG